MLEVVVHLLETSRLSKFVDVAHALEGRLECSDSLEDQIHADDAVFVQLPVRYWFLTKQKPRFLLSVDFEGGAKHRFRKGRVVVVIE
jgi:hypothetical protein